MEKVKIDPATIADLDQLVQLENQLFSCEKISRRQFRYLLGSKTALVFGIHCGRQLQGYLILLLRKNSTRIRIYSIGIAATAQGRGFGAMLLRFAEGRVQDMGGSRLTLEVSEINSRAIHLYQSLGFVTGGRKAGYYEDGRAAILMEKQLGRGGNDDSSSHEGAIYRSGQRQWTGSQQADSKEHNCLGS